MEPITWAAIALALVNGAGGKAGEKLSEGAITSARRLFSLLQVRSPQAAKRLEAAHEASDTSEVIDAEIVEEVKRSVENDPEMQAAMNDLSNAMQKQFGNVTNLGELAERIGFVIQGGYNPIRIDKLEV